MGLQFGSGILSQGLLGGLQLLQGRGGLLGGALNGGSVFVGGRQGTAERKLGEDDGIHLVGVLLIVGVIIGVGVLDLIQLGLSVVAGGELHVNQLHQPVVGHVGPESGPDKGVAAGQVVGDPGGFQLGQGGADGGLGLAGEGVALVPGLPGQGTVPGQLFHSQLQQMVVPGLAGGLVVDLLLYRLAGIKGIHLGLLGVDAVVVVLQVRRGVCFAVDIQGGEAALEDAAAPEHGGDGRDNDHHGNDSVNSHGPAVLLLLLAAFFVPFGLGMGLFLCTHSCFSPLIINSVRNRPPGPGGFRSRDKHFRDIILKTAPDCNRRAGFLHIVYKQKRPRQSSRGQNAGITMAIYTPLWPCGPV